MFHSTYLITYYLKSSYQNYVASLKYLSFKQFYNKSRLTLFVIIELSTYVLFYINKHYFYLFYFPAISLFYN